MSHGAPDSPNCYNCGALLHGPYCATCGQQALPLNPTVRGFLHDFGHELLHVDGKIVGSVRKLLTSPGFLTREQFAGRRVRWVAPIRMYLIFSVLYFALAALGPAVGTFKITKTDTTAGQDVEGEQSSRQLGFKNLDEMKQAVGHAQQIWLPRVMFVLVPLFAGLVAVAARRTGRNYPQHLYFALHVHAAWFAAGALLALTRWAAPDIVASVVQAIVTIYAVVYATIAFGRVYGLTTLSSILRMSAVLAVYFAATVVAFLAIVLPVLLSAMRAGSAAH